MNQLLFWVVILYSLQKVTTMFDFFPLNIVTSIVEIPLGLVMAPVTYFFVWTPKNFFVGELTDPVTGQGPTIGYAGEWKEGQIFGEGGPPLNAFDNWLPDNGYNISLLNTRKYSQFLTAIVNVKATRLNMQPPFLCYVYAPLQLTLTAVQASKHEIEALEEMKEFSQVRIDLRLHYHAAIDTSASATAAAEIANIIRDRCPDRVEFTNANISLPYTTEFNMIVNVTEFYLQNDEGALSFNVSLLAIDYNITMSPLAPPASSRTSWQFIGDLTTNVVNFIVTRLLKIGSSATWRENEKIVHSVLDFWAFKVGEPIPKPVLMTPTTCGDVALNRLFNTENSGYSLFVVLGEYGWIWVVPGLDIYFYLFEVWKHNRRS